MKRLLARSSRGLSCLALVAALLLTPAGALAADGPDPARVYYDAAVQAYTKGRYAVAVEAFTAAYQLAAKPSVLFSLAQAERRQFIESGEAKTLKNSIAHFRQYLKDVPEGGRRVDAIDALQELELLFARLATTQPPVQPLPGGTPEPPASPESTPSRLMISVSEKSAVVKVDDVEHGELPAVLQVTAGKHTVRTSAPGFIDDEREVMAISGTLVPIEIVLREKRSFLSLSAPAGAKLSIDGQLFGEAPLPNDIDLAPGSHLVTVTQTGYQPYQQSVTIERGSVTPLEVTLPRTTQRWLSFVAMGVSGVIAAGGLGLAIAAVEQEDNAKSIYARAQRQGIDEVDLVNYRASLSQRDDLRRVSGLTFGVAGALGLAALGLYYFDNPTPAPPDGVRGTSRARLAVSIGPGGAGVAMTGRF